MNHCLSYSACCLFNGKQAMTWTSPDFINWTLRSKLQCNFNRDLKLSMTGCSLEAVSISHFLVNWSMSQNATWEGSMQRKCFISRRRLNYSSRCAMSMLANKWNQQLIGYKQFRNIWFGVWQPPSFLNKFYLQIEVYIIKSINLLPHELVAFHLRHKLAQKPHYCKALLT